jgi:hypothetical protein
VKRSPQDCGDYLAEKMDQFAPMFNGKVKTCTLHKNPEGCGIQNRYTSQPVSHPATKIVGARNFCSCSAVEVSDSVKETLAQGKCEQLRYRVLICTSSLEDHKLNWFSILLLIKGTVVVDKKASTANIKSFRQAYVCNKVKYLG